MATSPRRALGRWIEPFAASLWTLFLLWTLLAAVVWIGGVGEAQVLGWTERQFHLPPRETGAELQGLQAALVSLLQWIDPVWICLAAANAYAFTALRESLATARRWAGLILLVVTLVLWLSAKSGGPLGPVHYTGVLGPQLGPVPVCLPLLWLAVVLGGRDFVLRMRPAFSQAPLAIGTGLLVLLFDFALEPVAWKMRAFWLWYPARLPAPSWPPVQNYLSWLILGALLTYSLREERVATAAQPLRSSPTAIYLLLLSVSILTNLAHLRS